MTLWRAARGPLLARPRSDPGTTRTSRNVLNPVLIKWTADLFQGVPHYAVS
jgi:hypothetical protein